MSNESKIGLPQRTRSVLSNRIAMGRFLFPIFIILVWQVLAIPYGYILADPVTVFYAIIDGLRMGWLTTTLLIGGRRLLTAFIIGGGAGVIIGLSLGYSAFLREIYEPILLTLYAVPKVATIPFFLIILGTGDPYIISYAALSAFFPIAVLMISGILSIDETYFKIGRAFRLSPWQTFRHIVVPAISLPLVIALRLGFNLAMIGLIVSGMYISSEGVGFQLAQGLRIISSARILAVTIPVVSVTVLVNYALYKLERSISKRVEFSDEPAI